MDGPYRLPIGGIAAFEQRFEASDGIRIVDVERRPLARQLSIEISKLAIDRVQRLILGVHIRRERRSRGLLHAQAGPDLAGFGRIICAPDMPLERIRGDEAQSQSSPGRPKPNLQSPSFPPPPDRSRQFPDQGAAVTRPRTRRPRARENILLGPPPLGLCGPSRCVGKFADRARRRHGRTARPCATTRRGLRRRISRSNLVAGSKAATSAPRHLTRRRRSPRDRALYFSAI